MSSHQSSSPLSKYYADQDKPAEQAPKINEAYLCSIKSEFDNLSDELLTLRKMIHDKSLTESYL